MKLFLNHIIVSIFFVLFIAQPASAYTEPEKIGSFNLPAAGFVENYGQFHDSVKFFAHFHTGDTFISKDGNLHYTLPLNDREVQGAKKFVTFKETFLNGHLSDISGRKPGRFPLYYHKGNNKSTRPKALTTFNSVDMGYIYDGIGCRLLLQRGGPEKIFTLAPGADPDDIKIGISGIEKLSINNKGELLLFDNDRPILFTAPIAYQFIDNKKKSVNIKYRINGLSYGFEVDDYDRSAELIIDPLLASTYLGGSNSEWSSGITVDKKGSVYITGTTISTDFHINGGAYTRFNGGETDIFISKLDSDLKVLLGSTYIGGSGLGSFEYSHGIVVDDEGEVFVLGETKSSDFPVSKESYDSTYNGKYDIVVLKLSNDLSRIISSTFIGGGGNDRGGSIALDNKGRVYITGSTTSSTDFPVTNGSSFHGGDSDTFLTILNNNLTKVISSFYVGGSSSDTGKFLSIYGEDSIYLGGVTKSSDFPGNNVIKRKEKDDYDSFVILFNGTTGALVTSTVIGGSKSDTLTSMDINGKGDVYISGITKSHDFPVSENAFDREYNGGDLDIFITKLDRNLSDIISSTYVGGVNSDFNYALKVSREGDLYFSGATYSIDFPIKDRAYDNSINGHYDMYISKLTGDLSQLLSSTYVGGVGGDWGSAIAFDDRENIIIAGKTWSTDFPTSEDSFDTTFNSGTYDVIVIKMDKELSK